MDLHFLKAPLSHNIPVIMAMLGVWYRNFWDYPAQAILPYSHDLRELPLFMQQLEMESNGKAAGTDTASIVFGEAGTNAQHTFMQMLHQSAEIIPADFVVFAKAHHPYGVHHDMLLGHALAQSKALADGSENEAEPHRHFPGNRPSSMVVLDRLDAHHLGMLVALYEHKVFVQGAIWGINSFDQWGVELGKKMAHGIIQSFDDPQSFDKFDSSTTGLLKHLKQCV
jgi:glucose-6-phosphate isomerase